MRKLIILFSLILIVTGAYTQDTIYYKGEKINVLDSLHRKQGVWKLYDDERHVRIDLNCLNDSIIGDIDVFQNDTLVLKIFRDKKGVKNYAAWSHGDTINKTENDFKLKQKGKTQIFGEDNYMDALRNNNVPQIAGSMSKYYGELDEFRDEFKYKIENLEVSMKSSRPLMVTFFIDTNGYIKVSKITGNNQQNIKNEVTRILESFPRWQPGFQDGHFVKVMYTLPVQFAK
jgi:hypothetical protein